MKRIATITVILIGFTLLSFFYIKDSKNVLPPGLYEYVYVSHITEGQELSKSSWKSPFHLGQDKKVAYRVINDSLIYKGYTNKIKKIYEWDDTLTRVPTKELTKFRPVPYNKLDYKLVGVYYAFPWLTDTFVVLYYSKKRNSILDELHVYTLGRLSNIAVYMNKPSHPFYDLEKYFKISKESDTTFEAPIQQIK